MTTLREAAQQALDFCEFLWREVAMNDYAEEQREATEAALRAALAEQDDDLTAAWMAGAAEERKRAERAQPVAWLWQHEDTGHTGFVDSWQLENGWQQLNPRLQVVAPLYTTPPAPVVPQPLSGLDVERLLEDVVGSLPVARKLIRAVEAAVLERMGVQR